MMMMMKKKAELGIVISLMLDGGTCGSVGDTMHCEVNGQSNENEVKKLILLGRSLPIQEKHCEWNEDYR